MVHVAREMKRLGFEMPLLIGGATTSPAHTAVKIDPEYDGAVVYVKDASRAVGVCQSLVTAGQRDAFTQKLKSDHAVRREQHKGRKVKAPAFTLAAARANRFRCDWPAVPPTGAEARRRAALREYPLEELVRYIDWTPFFHAWEFARQVPGHPHRPDGRRGGAQPVRRCAPRARADGHSRNAGCRQRP